MLGEGGLGVVGVQMAPKATVAGGINTVGEGRARPGWGRVVRGLAAPPLHTGAHSRAS